jgi:hypothetical protein
MKRELNIFKEWRLGSFRLTRSRWDNGDLFLTLEIGLLTSLKIEFMRLVPVRGAAE